MLWRVASNLQCLLALSRNRDEAAGASGRGQAEDSHVARPRGWLLARRGPQLQQSDAGKRLLKRIWTQGPTRARCPMPTSTVFCICQRYPLDMVSVVVYFWDF